MKKATQTGDYTATEAKQELNCANAKFWELIKAGELEAYYMGRHVRIVRESIAAYKQRNRVTPTKFIGCQGASVDPLS